MATTNDLTPGRLVDLSEDQCWDLVAGLPVGRLAWSGPEGISVIPVNYVTAERGITLHTHAYSTMAREVDDSPVAFQVDQIDEATRSGWSVLVRGIAHTSNAGLGGSGSRPDVWPKGTKAVHLTVAVTSITGRRVLPS